MQVTKLQPRTRIVRARFAPAYLVVQKYEVHLDENEGHSRGGGEGQHDVVALGVLLQLEILAEFQTRVDHRADAERHGAHSQIEAAVVLYRTYRIRVRASALRSVAVAAGAARRSRRVQIAHVLLLLCSTGFPIYFNILIHVDRLIPPDLPILPIAQTGISLSRCARARTKENVRLCESAARPRRERFAV